MKSLSRVRLLAILWTAAHQAPPSMGFSRQEYWSGGAIAFSSDLESLLISSVKSNFGPKTGDEKQLPCVVICYQ